MFSRSAEIYDAVFAAKGKNYAAECTTLFRILDEARRTSGTDLLEIACGTGGHTGYLKDRFTVTGIDIDPGMLAIARTRHPDVRFLEADMASFELAERFDVILCLFSAIGYMTTPGDLHRAIRTMAAHLKPGGLLVVEPWLAPGEYRPGAVFASFVDQPELKVSRINVNILRDKRSVIEFHYLVGRPSGVEYFTETHELGLFTREEYTDAFAASGLEVRFLADGLIGRGMYLAFRPSEA
jgi:SAM-dependent methyltransferase